MSSEGQPPAEYSGRRMELSIKECPSEIAMAFIEFARKKWHGKQWVALKDLMQMAENDEVKTVLFQRLGVLEAYVEKHETILSTVQVMPRQEKEEKAPEQRPADKVPRTFARAAREHQEGETCQGSTGTTG